MLFFAHASVVESLPPRVREARVPDDQPVRDFCPPAQRLRRFLLRRLSPRNVSRLAILKHRYVVWKLRSSDIEP
jgi:hypothetical protein